jgi:hypothetical protein
MGFAERYCNVLVVVVLTAYVVRFSRGLPSQAVGHTWATRLSNRLTSFAEDHLKVSELQRIYEQTATYQVKPFDGATALASTTNLIANRLNNSVKSLQKSKDTVERSLRNSSLSTTVSQPCCVGNQTRNSSVFDVRFNQSLTWESCESSFRGLGRNMSSAAWNPYDGQHSGASEELWRYFGDKDGNYYQYPASDRFCRDNLQPMDHRFK